MLKFETGKTYATRSVCDYDCIISATIVKRTAKTVTVETNRGVKLFRVSTDWQGNESFKPWGSFSMAPVISADDLVAE